MRTRGSGSVSIHFHGPCVVVFFYALGSGPSLGTPPRRLPNAILADSIGPLLRASVISTLGEQIWELVRRAKSGLRRPPIRGFPHGPQIPLAARPGKAWRRPLLALGADFGRGGGRTLHAFADMPTLGVA